MGSSIPTSVLSAKQTARLSIDCSSVSRQLVWFRKDLRVHDNPALAAAASSGEVSALFVDDPVA
ncbi:MAG: deoxyribodipyrimidine photo-lyase, partial [Acidimicrobiales bacterium]|nr:deoxyribodipyrimidine photo-lyase [Acidimicrobiales bacterium]